jgi:hypothetical protein
MATDEPGGAQGALPRGPCLTHPRAPVFDCLIGRQLGILGDARVNVLELNRALDDLK